MDPSTWQPSSALYDAVAAGFDESFERPGHRRAYDVLAGEFIASLLPPPPAVIVDAGCGTGRWPLKWLAQGYRVIGIEESRAMIDILRQQVVGPGFTLVEANMDQAVIEPGSVDVVVAMGSLQYVADPAATLQRFAGWVKPGGVVCVHVDSCVGLVLDLVREGQREEALLRSDSLRGKLTYAAQSADLHLYDRETLSRDVAASGLTEICCHGLLVSASALGRKACAQAMTDDPEGFLAFERRLAANPALADAGLHLIAWGRRPISSAEGAG